jgi:hypothetical protein
VADVGAARGLLDHCRRLRCNDARRYLSLRSVLAHLELTRMDCWCDVRPVEQYVRYAVYPHCSKAWTLASLAATPFAPFATTFVNTAAMEAQFLLRARKQDKLRRPLLAHCLLAGSGLGLFALDEVKPHIGCVHAVWHLLSCAAMQQTVPLLQDSGRRAPGANGDAGSWELQMQAMP